MEVLDMVSINGESPKWINMDGFFDVCNGTSYLNP
jgi:hypothetical protein